MVQVFKPFNHMVVMLEEFHTTMSFVGTVRYLIRYSGFESIPHLIYADRLGNYYVSFVWMIVILEYSFTLWWLLELCYILFRNSDYVIFIK